MMSRLGAVSEVTISSVDADGREIGTVLKWWWEATAPDVGRGAYRVDCHVEGFGIFTGTGPDYFEALRRARISMEDVGLRPCCAGARRDTWASGMQRDMGQGLACYVLSLPRTKIRPPEAGTFDAATPDVIGTVADQEAFHGAWVASPLG
jgi:hypothetical protein